MDNILISYEITHYLMNKREGDFGYVALSKAYDSVEQKLDMRSVKLGVCGRFEGRAPETLVSSTGSL